MRRICRHRKESMTLHFNHIQHLETTSLLDNHHVSNSRCRNPGSLKRWSKYRKLIAGIGLGLARHILRQDPQLTVIATSRTPKETEAAILENQDDESSLSKRLRVMELDVTKEDTIQSARQQVEDEFGKGNIKCLFNISGIVVSVSNAKF
jgi:hypothetical protein